MDNKKMFDDAIGELPPSTVRMEEAIVRGRRAARIRNVTTPTLGVAAIVVLTVGAVSFMTMRGPGEVSAGSSTPSPQGSGCPSESSESTARRLTTLARELTTDRLDPGARLFPNGEEEALEFVVKVKSKMIGAESGDGCARYEAEARIQSNERWGGIGIGLSTDSEPPFEPPCAEERSSPNGHDTICTSFTGDDGERIGSRVAVEDDGLKVNNVFVIKPDGTQVNVTVTTGTSSPSLPQPPLTTEQAIEIALDPGMTLYP